MMQMCDIRDECTDETSTVVMEDYANNNLDETHRDVYEHNNKTSRNAMKMAIEEFPDGHDVDKKKT